VLAAILAPLLAALWPILKGAAITVREAIATYGLGGDFGISRLDRAVERIGTRLLPSPYGVSLGNLFRRKGRLALTLLVLVTAGIMTLIVMSLVSSTQLTLDNEMARRLYDVRIGFVRSQPTAEILAVIDTVEGTEDAQIWYSRNATLLRQGERLQDSAGLGAQLTGIPVGTEMYRPIVAQRDAGWNPETGGRSSSARRPPTRMASPWVMR
jgi:putative ABC transport system permease protein